MNCTKSFFEIYNREPDNVSFCPYRVVPIGAHSDFQFGCITGMTIDKGIHIAYSPKKIGIVEVRSLQFDKRAQWVVNETPAEKQNDWADYLRGATVALHKRYNISIGLCGVIEGSLPIGGLSSSAAVTIAFILALCDVNYIKISQEELIQVALSAEVDYVGVNVGTTDQSCEIFSKKDSLLHLDTLDSSFELIPISPKMKPFKIAIFFSGLERSLAGTALNMRVDEVRSAAYALKAFAGMEYGKFKDTNLRQIPYEVYLEHKDKLPLNWCKRAEHWYTEQNRVELGVEAWRKGDIDVYGKLSFESGMSSINNWETGSPELKTLYEIMTETDGIYGGRFSGAGFKGCCMALIDPSYEQSITQTVTEKYLKQFPNLKGKFSVHICESADGVKL